MKHCAIALTLAAGITGSAMGAVSYSTNGGTYSQDFNSLISSGTNQAWANDTTLTGWHLFRGPVGSEAAITTYNAIDGSNNTGSFISFGTTGSGERSLGGTASGGAYFGSPASGALAGWIAVAITNNTTDILDSFTVGFNGEQWRNGGNTSAQTMVLQYGFGATFTSVSTWNTPGGTFNFVSPVVGSTAAAVDGNAAGRVNGLGGTINSLTWAIGDTLWIRWVENNDIGNDHGLSIDDFSFSAVPTPGTALLLAAGGMMAARRRRA